MSVFMGHGSYDSVISSGLGESSRDVLQEHGYDVTWKQYPMDHSVCELELQDIRNFLLKYYL